MRPNLSACKRRVNAAEAKFKTLQGQMQATIDGYGKPVIRVGYKSDRQPNAVLMFVKEIMPPDPKWDDEIAHIAYDLRSALDQLMTQLYIASNGKRPPKRAGPKKGPAQTLQFPICSTRRAFDVEIKKRRMEGLDNQFGHLVWHHEPLRLRTKKKYHALSLLEVMSNTDKHRHPNVVGIGFDKIQFAANPIAASCTALKIEPAPGAAGVLKKGTYVARVHFTPTGIGQPGVEMYLEGTAHPAFDNGLWVEQVVSAMIAEVRGIVGSAQALIDDKPPAYLVVSARAKSRRKTDPPPWPAP